MNLPVPTSFMGVVAWPLPEPVFDRRIFLKTISEKNVCKNKSYDQRFLGNSIINAEIMAKNSGWWKIFHDNTFTFYVIAQHMDNHYDFEVFCVCIYNVYV